MILTQTTRQHGDVKVTFWNNLSSVEFTVRRGMGNFETKANYLKYSFIISLVRVLAS